MEIKTKTKYITKDNAENKVEIKKQRSLFGRQSVFIYGC